MIPIDVLRKRRNMLLSKMISNSAILIFSTPENKKRQHYHFFTQNKDFWYFTGFNEPNALFLMIKINDNHHQKILFNRKKDYANEIWDGPRLGQDLALIKIDVDKSFPWENINENLYKLLIGLKTIYHAWGEYIKTDQLIFNTIKYLRNVIIDNPIIPNNIIDWRPLVHKMRLFKEPHEIKTLRIAGKISALAHIRAMKSCRPGMFEYQLEGEIHHEFNCHGARFPSYNTIIGSGKNSCILHYTENNNKMLNGDLVLVDAGCNFNGYASDITRTFPINGKFSKQQREIYNIVLNSLKIALSMLRPNINICEIKTKIAHIMIYNLIKLGLLQGSLDQLIAKGAHKQFFMHNLCHWLGLDVHDVGLYGCSIDNTILKPNMVLTIEPGIYIAENANVPFEYRGIGIRIEDNVLITEIGNENLTDSVVKEIEEIENLMTLKD
ncbi:Xaa-Pro aminopeptidase [Candidatus Pantoea edessiphila]|uniref:Xaa-Pro aminopeptidase n=1 Tax=Candidatus Pantoea edessiphila TaxID=2044610 RepID=A0A2P5T1L0_9GAMM|nr:Xaa-Pro aminopeptidase [Candidatus Pantoea edessiphila]PPI88443.1 Xaa-Pro aminopeptidase [Candidatus Pantoea edessiphila]